MRFGTAPLPKKRGAVELTLAHVEEKARGVLERYALRSTAPVVAGIVRHNPRGSSFYVDWAFQTLDLERANEVIDRLIERRKNSALVLVTRETHTEAIVGTQHVLRYVR